MTRLHPHSLYDGLEALLAPLRKELEASGLRQATVDAALAGLDRLPPAIIARADGAIAAAAGLHPRWPCIRPGDSLWPIVERWAPPMPRLAGVEYLFLFHRSGWLREAALKRLEGPVRSPFFFAAIAYRLNDWVPEVRRSARDCAGRTFPATDPAIVAEAALFLLGRRSEWRRWQSGEAEMLDAAIARPGVTDRLAQLLMGATTGPMARTLGFALRRAEMDRHLPALATDAVMPSVRAKATRTLLDEEATWLDVAERRWIDKSMGLFRRGPGIGRRKLVRDGALEDLVAQAARDRSAAVRRLAADALIRHGTTLGNVSEVAAMLEGDRTRAVRERIEFLNRQPRDDAGSVSAGEQG